MHGARHRPHTRRRVASGRRRDYVLCGCAPPPPPSRIVRFAARLAGLTSYGVGVAFALVSTYALLAPPMVTATHQSPRLYASANFTIEDWVATYPR